MTFDANQITSELLKAAKLALCLAPLTAGRADRPILHCIFVLVFLSQQFPLLLLLLLQGKPMVLISGLPLLGLVVGSFTPNGRSTERVLRSRKPSCLAHE